MIGVNEAGDSAPSTASVPVTVRASRVPPRIKGPVKDVKTKAGLRTVIEIPFTGGSPLPNVEWLCNDKVVDVQNPGAGTTEVVDGKAIIMIPSPSRANEHGLWKVRLVNEFGSDEATFRVNVLDKPSSPKGPLEVSGVSKDSCVLTWQPPDDDGGSPITNYIVEKKDSKGEEWKPVSSTIAGTSFKVPKLKEGSKYEFRVMAENAMGVSPPLLTASPVLAKDPFGIPSAPGKPEAVDQSRDFITIQWTAPRDDGGSPLEGYDVERMDERGKWVKVHKVPVRELSFTDTNVQPNKEYQYRVTARNKAGKSDPSAVSDKIKARPLKEAPAVDFGALGREIRVRAGEPLNVIAAVKGSPFPKIEWSKDEQAISASPRITLEGSDDEVKLSIPSCVRTDAGQYVVRLSNIYGEAEGTIKVRHEDYGIN